MSFRRPPRWVLLTLGVAMSLLIAAEAVGHWLNNRGIGALLEALGSNDSEFLGKSAQRELEIGNFGDAERKARHAAVAMPLNQRGVRVLGMAELAQDQPQGAETLRTAGFLGWRDVPTQTWLMVDNLQRQDNRNTMYRADALARRSGMRPEVFAMMVLFAAQPGTRPLLMERLKLNPDWRSDFFRLARLATAEEATTLGSLLRQLKATDVPPTREEVAPLVRRLVDLQAFAEADSLAIELLGSRTRSPKNAVWDGGFAEREAYEDPDYVRTPFDWELGSAPGVTVFVDGDQANEAALYVQTNGSRATTLARQTIQLSPGNHLFRFSVRSEQPDVLDRLHWRIKCLQSGTELLPDIAVPAGGGPKVVEVPITVPAQCDAQLLRLEADSYMPRATAAARFDDVAVVPRP